MNGYLCTPRTPPTPYNMTFPVKAKCITHTTFSQIGSVSCLPKTPFKLDVPMSNPSYLVCWCASVPTYIHIPLRQI